MTEAEFTQTVRDLARQCGWLEYHTHRSDRSPAGFPDLVLARAPRLIFAELKVGSNKPTKAQREWLNALNDGLDLTPEVYLWYPRDLDYPQGIPWLLSRRRTRLEVWDGEVAGRWLPD
jgi:hypothetical protein